ncbi:retron St85 family RNA-directed DNA polymerase [Pseudomonas mosselii]|uniref:RNA-directed DNA polymerase n=1 Tax=Pseudomonas mosselii TaxID=78327 RepID=A0A7W2PZ73_9PSED|nr:retron St85 family RNA-directed DNA polymerase [Pseudomonas mosselii]MBA6066291.1 RNA-directed DNA polymerase [Pseudomonas mosselii]
MSHYNFRKQISEEFMISEHDVSRLILRAPYAYKRYTIPKKGGGVRHIAQPAKETKIIQHHMIHEWFSKLPIHHCAAAYKTGASIKKNAELHSNSTYISKFDFVNFFGSITALNIKNLLQNEFNNIISEASIEDMSRMSCIRDKATGRLVLSIGAPSSPILSNAVMLNFDTVVHQWCSERGIIYSRYADDLTFSSNERGATLKIQDFIQGTLKELPNLNLILNTDKTIHASKKNQRRVTGLILSNDNKVTIGRDKKRLISAMIHRFSHNELNSKEIMHLQGLVSFAQHIEPLFVAKLRGKYSTKLITELLRSRGDK